LERGGGGGGGGGGGCKLNSALKLLFLLSDDTIPSPWGNERDPCRRSSSVSIVFSSSPIMGLVRIREEKAAAAVDGGSETVHSNLSVIPAVLGPHKLAGAEHSC